MLKQAKADAELSKKHEAIARATAAKVNETLLTTVATHVEGLRQEQAAEREALRTELGVALEVATESSAAAERALSDELASLRENMDAKLGEREAEARETRRGVLELEKAMDVAVGDVRAALTESVGSLEKSLLKHELRTETLESQASDQGSRLSGLEGLVAATDASLGTVTREVGELQERTTGIMGHASQNHAALLDALASTGRASASELAALKQEQAAAMEQVLATSRLMTVEVGKAVAAAEKAKAPPNAAVHFSIALAAWFLFLSVFYATFLGGPGDVERTVF